MVLMRTGVILCGLEATAGGPARHADHFAEGASMKKHNHFGGAALGVALAWSSAQAEVKDPLPDSLSLGGVTLYATVDVGYA